MKKSKRIIIVGAGPVGCYLAQLLKHYGFSPLVLEEHAEVGRPVSCAGIVGHKVFSGTQLPLSKESILNVIDGANISYKDINFVLNRPKVAYIIDRARFDKELSQGLDIKFNTKVIDLEPSAFDVKIKTSEADYFADILVGADGPNSVVRKNWQFDSSIRLYKGYQYRLKFEPKQKNLVTVDYSHPFSLFTWLIPEGNGLARIGSISDKPVAEIDEFMKKNKIEGEIIEKNAGPIPIGTCQLVKGNVALVGDAAAQIKPISAGGIYYGLKSAEILAGAIRDGDIALYEPRWKQEFEQEIKLCLLIRYATENVNGRVLSRAFEYVRDNASLIEKIGDFENHSSVLWTLISNPRTFSTVGSVAFNLLKQPRWIWRYLIRKGK